jgi:hypothetical protein
MQSEMEKLALIQHFSTLLEEKDLELKFIQHTIEEVPLFFSFRNELLMALLPFFSSAELTKGK